MSTSTATPVMTGTVTSPDGTSIAYDQRGQGPALVIVDGAMCHRGLGPSQALAAALSDRFTVYRYDRRGRGDSGQTMPYAVEREIEDLAALLEVSGPAFLLGPSSGGALALEAARAGLPVRALAMYEVPFMVEGAVRPVGPDLAERLDAAVAAGTPGKAVGLFLEQVGAPAPVRLIMHLTPVWKRLTAVAHTLSHDIRCIEANARGQALDAGQWAHLRVPVLVISGGKSPESMRNGNLALAEAIPGARHESLPGQNHMVKAAVVGPVVTAFFQSTTTVQES